MLISKSQLLKIHECTSVANQEEIEEWFPELFKPELEVDKWFKLPNNHNWKICISEIDWEKKRAKAYGFSSIGDYVNEDNGEWWTFNALGSAVECSTAEVHKALLAEAINKGFIEGCYHTMTNKLGTIKSRGNNFGYIKTDNKLLFNNYSIFQKGVWAKVLPEITLEEAEKKFQCRILLNK